MQFRTTHWKLEKMHFKIESIEPQAWQNIATQLLCDDIYTGIKTIRFMVMFVYTDIITECDVVQGLRRSKNTTPDSDGDT